MKAAELKMALAIAQDYTIDLTQFQGGFDRLFGCGCPDFVPCEVPLGAVAKHLRWQCLFLNGSWDWEEYQNCRAIFLKRNWVTVSELSVMEFAETIRAMIEPKLLA